MFKVVTVAGAVTNNPPVGRTINIRERAILLENDLGPRRRDQSRTFSHTR